MSSSHEPGEPSRGAASPESGRPGEPHQSDDPAEPGEAVDPEPADGRPTPSRGGSSLLGALSWYAFSYGFAVLGYLAINAVVSRWLGLGAFGYFVIATTVSTGVGQFALFGAHRAGLRDASVMNGTGDDDAVLGSLRSNARAATIVMVPVVSVLAAGVFFLVVDGSGTADRVVLAVAFGLLVYLNGLQKLWANYLRGLGAIRLASALEGRSGGALVALAQAGFVALGWWLLEPAGLAGALVAFVLGFLLPVLAAGRVVQRRWRHLGRATGVLTSVRRSMRRNWRFAVNQFATYLGATVEIWMAGLLLGALDTSLFSAAQRLSLLIAIPLVSLQVVFAPVTARLLDSGDRAGLERVLRTGSTMAALMAAVLWVPSLVAPGQVLGVVFGSDFSAGAWVLVTLSLGSAVNVFTGLSGTVLTMSHREGVAALVLTVVLVLRIVVGTAAGLVWGLEGLAVSSAALSTLQYAVMWSRARTLLGVRTHATLRPDLRALRSTRG